jgi:hypothetical protein
MIHQTVIRGAVDTAKGDGVLIGDENLKILPRLQMHLLAHGAGQDNLPLL